MPFTQTSDDQIQCTCGRYYTPGTFCQWCQKSVEAPVEAPPAEEPLAEERPAEDPSGEQPPAEAPAPVPVDVPPPVEEPPAPSHSEARRSRRER